MELYKRFQAQHPRLRISLRSFEGLKPFFVRKLKDRYTCCCIAHVQMMFLRDAFNHMRQQSFGLHGPSCKCRCVVCSTNATQEAAHSQCTAAKQTRHSITDIWEGILCPKPTSSEFHAKSCLLGDCNACGTSRLMLCPNEVSNDALLLSVKVFEDIETEHCDEEGNKKKRKDLLVKSLKVQDFISLFQKHIATFTKHNFIVRWQSQQFKNCLLKFPNDVVVSVIDFAENYSFKEQNEIQSMHWYSSQVTILVHITYFRKVSNEVQKVMHFYISDDKNHDTLFVQHCLLLHVGWLKQQNLFPNKHWVWSDGAASQFKAKRPFYFVARYFQMTGVEMMWNFFASGHGKGEHDGAGAVIKRTLTQEQLKPVAWHLKCAGDVVAFLKHKFCGPGNVQVCRIFWEIKESDVDRERKWDCKRVTSSRSMHCVNGYSVTDKCALRCRQLSCFCDSCMLQRWRRCSNVAYVDVWEYRQLIPVDVDDDSGEDSSDEELDNIPLYAGHHDALSDALCVGDNFATNPTEKDADFYILKCSAAKHKTTRARKDQWGNCVSANTYVVEGYYYEKVDGHTDLYYIPTNQPLVLLPSHLVRAVKFEMECVLGNPNLFRVSLEVQENIYNSMPLNL